MDTELYFIDKDSNGNWYFIPVKNREAWNVWSDLPEEEEESGLCPDYAIPMDAFFGIEKLTGYQFEVINMPDPFIISKHNNTKP